MKPSSKLPSDFSADPKPLHRWQDPNEVRSEQTDFAMTPVELAEKVVVLRDGGGMPFTTAGRPYLLPIYNHWHKRMVIVGGRQIEKSQSYQQLTRLSDGSQKIAGHVKVGDELATMATDGRTMTTGTVVWKSRIYKKPVLRIKTRQGHKVEVATTHPMRTWESWTEAGLVKVGDRLAAVRRCGEFTNKYVEDERIIRCIAKLIGDGHFKDNGACSLTGLPGPVTWEFMEDTLSLGETGRIGLDKRSAAISINIRKGNFLLEAITRSGLQGSRSWDKHIPAWVFDLSREQTALFLNRLWSTDGHVKKATASQYNIEYCSISEELVLQVQSLLHKFGIPSCIRENLPSYWKRRGKPENIAYILRIETQEGYRRFLTEIGALGKTEDLPLPDMDANSNTDTLPIEVNELIREILDVVPAKQGAYQRLGIPSPKDVGLRRTLKYAPSPAKIQLYLGYMRAYPWVYDQQKVDVLEGHCRSDLFWDTIESIEDLGEIDCVDFEVETTHNFVCGSLITHNSTTMSNLILVPAVTDKGYRSLMVSPTDTHTRTFAYDKLDGTLNASPYLMQLLGGRPRIDNLYHKEFRNSSSILLRSAYLTARSARGIPADQLLIDEAQDMIPGHLPVLAETLTHSHKDEFGRRIVIAGTALTDECMIGEFWKDHSTQGEWVLRCSAGHPNILGLENLTEKGLVCSCTNAEGVCGRALNPRVGTWEHQYPERLKKNLYVGYRIPQVINPMVYDHWDDIAIKLRTYSTARLFQEVLGLSYDSGTKPVNMTQLRHAERNGHKMSSGREYVDQPIMGIDWGYGDVSFTVVTIGGWNQRQNFQYIYAKKFTLGQEVDPEYQLQFILSLLHQFNVFYVGCDWGAGWGQNARLKTKFPRTADFIHSHGQKAMIKWSKSAQRYTINRTETMTNLFEAFKTGRIEAFEGYAETFGKDYLNVSATTDRFGHVMYTHSPSRPDDSVHSALYPYLIGRILRKEIQPLEED